jgi:HAE1 family hydrophobic/amphiphilic exporter-1
MKHLYEIAVHRPVLVTIGLITLLALGSISVYKLPIEFFPEMDFPFIGIIVPYPNALPSHVEKQITKPLEEVLSTLGNVRQIFSESAPEGAFVGVVFDWGRDVDVLRMEVKEKVDQIRGDLPRDIERIQLLTFDSNDQPIMVGRISAKGRDLMGSYDLLEKTIINPLKRIEGVGQVGIDGIEPEEVSIYLEMDRIKAHNVDVGRLFSQIQNMNLTTSLGEVTAAGVRYNVRGIGSFADFEEVENLPISQSGLRLRDVATVYFGEPLITYGRHLDGESCIAFWIQKASGANAVELGRTVEKQLDKISHDPRLEGINVLLFWNQSEQILNSVNGLKQAGIIGAIFAVTILYFFLRRVSTTLIVAISIPFAILCTCAFLYFTGRTLNVLTMMGLMLGVGMLVDNAIVVLESIFRNQLKSGDSMTAAIVGSKQVAVAVTAATLTSVIVFAPVIFTKDPTGLMSILGHVGVTISVALIFSWVISLTLIPFLTSRLLKPKEAKSSRMLHRTEDRYLRILRWTTVKRPFLTGLVIIPTILILSIVSAKMLKLEVNMEEGELIENLYISYDFTDNLTYDQTEKWVDRVESVLFEKKEELGVTKVYSYYADNEAGTTIYFEDKYLTEKKLKETRKELREALPDLAGVTLRFGDEQGAGSGGVKRIRVTLFGEDMDLLNEFAAEAKRRLSLIDGLEDVRTSVEMGREEIKVSLNRDAAQRHGISPQAVSGIMNLTFRGMPLRRFQTGDREVPMTISLSPEDKVGIYNLENLLVGVNEGRELTLGSIADLTVSRGPTTIRRQHQKAAVSVEGAYYRGEAKDMMGKVSSVMNTMKLPVGYSWSYSDEIREEQNRQIEMLVNILLAIVCVYLVMAALFESLLHPLVIMACLPFSIIGVIWALLITRTDVNLMVFIGAVILIGIVVNNGIVLIDHVNNFRRQGRTIYDAIFEGGRERLRPILMTALTTILGLAPMAVGRTNIAGTQYYPLARAVMGGLAVGTLLTLVALPTYYVIAERLTAWTRRIWAKAKQPRPRVSTPVAPR